ncbi:hypothetical protein Hamer_G019847 [Homarus americanus]|uniref:Uncharacterized protein n=1 Tax=Homarus americanus TaxID=6706 RepID=A0A8J5JK97_HOMAM|nr:hypothetical protein Hamer_G019847 [Homarus americanus]
MGHNNGELAIQLELAVLMLGREGSSSGQYTCVARHTHTYITICLISPSERANRGSERHQNMSASAGTWGP